MDEQNILESEDVCESHLDSSKTSAENPPSGLLLSAEHSQAAHLLPVDTKQRSAGNDLISVGSQALGIERCALIPAEIQRLAGDGSRQQRLAISLSARKRLDESISDETCINRGLLKVAGKEVAVGDVRLQMQAESTLNVDVDCTSSSQHTTGVQKSVFPQYGSVPVIDDFNDTEEMPEISERKQDAALHVNRQVNAFACADSVMMPGTPDDAVHLSPDEQEDVASKCMSVYLDGAQQSGAPNLVHNPVESMKDEGHQGEASLEMLSVAVESFENMQRESEGCSGGGGKVAGKDFLAHDDAVEPKHHLTLANCGLLNSSVKKSMGDSEDIGSFIFDNNALAEKLQNKDHFLSLLCELAAAQQQEQEYLVKQPNKVTSYAASFVGNEASGDPRRLSFVDLLRKQMAQAGTFTELTADALYEQLLRKNQAILGTTLAKNFNPLLPSAGISSNAGNVTALEMEQISNDNSDKKGGFPLNDEVTGDSGKVEAQDEVDGRSTGGDEKEDTRGEEKKLGVGDLVWAKVKSHPWWPGQIFNAADASVAAKKIQRPGRTLVAFFGDGTFGWLQQSQLIAFRPNFDEKVKQTTMKSFCRAVAEALNEVSRRTELGLRCSHSSDAVYSKDVFPDLNAGMRKGVRIKRHQDIRMSRERFEPKRVLEFLQSAARLPWYSLKSGLEYTELCGHVYGFRNFMLSPKKPKSKIVPQNMRKVQNKLKTTPSSSLKRRLGQDETGEASSLAQAREGKRLHVNMMKEQHAGSKVLSSKFRTIDNLLLTEANEKEVIDTDTEVKSSEHARGSTWLVKGKRLHVSQDCKEGKRLKGWHSLGPLGGLADSGAADNLTSTDDDLKTLLDITGYHSLKRKKKGGALKCITDIVSKKVEQQPVEASEELLSNKSLIKLEKPGEEEGNFPDSSASSLSTVVPEHNLSVSSLTKQCGIVEECDKVKEELPDLMIDDAEEMEKGNRELLDAEVFDADNIEEGEGGIQVSKVGEAQEIEEDKGEQQNFRDPDAEEHEKEKGELPDLKVGDVKESEKDEGKVMETTVLESLLQDVNDNDNISEKQTKSSHSHSKEHVEGKGELPDLKVGDADDCEKEDGKLEKSEALLQDVKDHDNILKRKHTKHLKSHSQEHYKDKGELLDLRVGDGEESEKDKVKILDSKELKCLWQDVNDHDNILKKKKKQAKRLHSQEDTLSRLVKAKKRKQHTCEEGEKQPSPSLKNDHLGSIKLVKSSKLGASIKKVADTLKGSPASLKVANNLSAKRSTSAVSIESEAKKYVKSPRSNQSPVFKNDANFTGSFAKLLDNLQAIAKDPLSNANMKSSLHGVMPAFLKFRSMVFLKSSGYGAAGAGKLVSSCGNGHLFGDKKINDKSGSGKQTLQKSHVTDISEERKAIVKAEPPSESVGPGSQKHAAQDSLGELKGAAVKRPRPLSTALGSQKSDLPKGSITASNEVPICPKDMASGTQKLGVQELAVAARKKKSEVLKEHAAKLQVKNEVHKGQNLSKEKMDKEKFTDARHHAKSVKHHISRAETLSLPEKKSPMYNSVDVKVAQTSLGLFMQFPEDFTLPSEAHLKEIFNPFGILELAGIRVYRNASTAQVVFKHSTDAEAAWQHARKNRMFGHANVSYRLRHFTLSSKSNSKYFEIASVKNGLSAEAADVKSQVVENHGRAHHLGAEQGGSVGVADSPARISSLSREGPMDSRTAAQSPVLSTSLSKAEPVRSPDRSTSVSRTESGGTVVPEPASVSILSDIRAEPVSATIPAPAGSHSNSAEQGVSKSPASASVDREEEALPSLGSHVPLHSNLFSPPSVSNVNAPSGDIQDQMLKLLQQVSVIVSSSTFTPRTT